MVSSILNIASPKSPKEQVIGILGSNCPLSVKEIHNRLVKQFSYGATYQATHKVVQEMVCENILVKQDKKYLLNAFKITETRKALEELEDRIKTIKPSGDSDSKVYFFGSFKEWGNKTLPLLVENTNPASGEKWYIYQDFTVSLLTMSKEEYDWFSQVSSCGGYIIYKGNTLMDKLINGLWEKTGFKTKNVKNYNRPYAFFVYGDLVYQTVFPAELKNRFKKIYKKTKKIEEINTDEYYQAYYGPAAIQLTIIKNKELAEKLRKEIKKFFGEENAFS